MKKIFLFLTLLLFILPVHSVRAELKIDITRGQADPLPIALTKFTSDDATLKSRAEDISSVVMADLKRSGLFNILPERSYIQTSDQAMANPRFADWRVIGSQALIVGGLSKEPDGRLKVEFRLWDVLAEDQLIGMSYQTVDSNWRRIAHIIADDIYQRITGEDGYFDTRIVYVSETGPAKKRIKRLAIMDQDGDNHRFLTDGSALVLTPRFSPTLQTITYMAYYNDRPRVYLLDLDTGRQKILGDFPGMTFAPRFSPDGEKVIMSMAKGGNSEIYSMDLKTRQAQRLTFHPAIDTSPSYSPDGNFITFNSDRGGSQQLYTMNKMGKDVKRISFAKGRYGTPVWSPRGDLIAFTKIDKGRFHIGVMRPDGSGERLLTESFADEAPTWSPNGRVLLFFRETPADRNGNRSVRIMSIDLTGHNLRELPTPLDASDPAWSPLIP